MPAAVSVTWRPSASIAVLRQRDAMLQSLRRYFQSTHSLEVTTPSLSFTATTDPHIDSFTVCDGGESLWLHSSPEFAMKRLLAAYRVDIHQLATVYRQNESGRQHNREFCLLEWYRVGFTLESLIEEAALLINTARLALSQSELCTRVVSYQAAVKELCGAYPNQLSLTDIVAVFTARERSFPDSFMSAADQSQTIDDALNLLVDEFVVSEFSDEEITALIDYPASQASLARTASDVNAQLVARRAELFIGTVELANGFEELSDAAEQRRRFEHDNAQRLSAGKPEMPIDERLINALHHGLPDSAGMAMGLDRLLMVLTGNRELSSVVAFQGAYV